MTEHNQKQLGNTLWSIADQLRGAMDADDFRDYTSFRGSDLESCINWCREANASIRGLAMCRFDR